MLGSIYITLLCTSKRIMRLCVFLSLQESAQVNYRRNLDYKKMSLIIMDSPHDVCMMCISATICNISGAGHTHQHGVTIAVWCIVGCQTFIGVFQAAKTIHLSFHLYMRSATSLRQQSSHCSVLVNAFQA